MFTIHGTRFVHDVSCASYHSIHRWISHVWCFSANLSRFEKIPIHLQSAKEKEGQTHWIFPESLKFKVQGKALHIAWFFRTCLWMKRSTATKQIKLFERWTEAIAKMWMLLAGVKELKLLNILTHFLFLIDVPFSSEFILICDQAFLFPGIVRNSSSKEKGKKDTWSSDRKRVNYKFIPRGTLKCWTRTWMHLLIKPVSL